MSRRERDWPMPPAAPRTATYECKKSCRDTALRVGSGSSGVCVGFERSPWELIREMFPLRDARLGAQIGDRGGFATPGHDPIR